MEGGGASALRHLARMEDDIRRGTKDWYNVAASVRTAVAYACAALKGQKERMDGFEARERGREDAVARAVREAGAANPGAGQLDAVEAQLARKADAARLEALDERVAQVAREANAAQSRLAVLEERVARAVELADSKCDGGRAAALEQAVAVLRERHSLAPPPTPVTPGPPVVATGEALDVAESALREAHAASVRCEQMEEARRREASRARTSPTPSPSSPRASMRLTCTACAQMSTPRQPTPSAPSAPRRPPPHSSSPTLRGQRTDCPRRRTLRGSPRGSTKSMARCRRSRTNSPGAWTASSPRWPRRPPPVRGH